MRSGAAEAGTRALGAWNDICVLESSWGRGEKQERGSKGRIQGSEDKWWGQRLALGPGAAEGREPIFPAGPGRATALGGAR